MENADRIFRFEIACILRIIVIKASNYPGAVRFPEFHELCKCCNSCFCNQFAQSDNLPVNITDLVEWFDMVSSYCLSVIPLLLYAFSVSALFSTNHLPLSFASLILYSLQHIFIHMISVFCALLISCFPIFSTFLNLFSYVHTAWVTLEIICNSFMRLFYVMQIAEH